MGARAEREILKRQYGADFARRVDKMSDSQVIAIYLRKKAKGELK